MRTKIARINSRKPETNKIRIAAQIIKRGGLVAFPTETVYGLGADIFNPSAVKKIFLAKNRPTDDPLIAHIANIKDLRKLTKKIPEKALILARKFWPGPLTIIFEKSASIPDIATAKLKTIAIRMPDNKIALKLIETSGTPVVAPSANTFSRPSPTTAQHVFHDLKNKIPLILDGGQTKIGIESTVLDLTSKIPTILRPGKITLEQLKKLIPKIKISFIKTKNPKSPGMKYKHYSPKAKVILVAGNKKGIEGIKNKYQKSNKNIAIIWANRTAGILSRDLFKKFREFDNKKMDIIIVQGVQEKGIGLALMNRLKRAATKIINFDGQGGSRTHNPKGIRS